MEVSIHKYTLVYLSILMMIGLVSAVPQYNKLTTISTTSTTSSGSSYNSSYYLNSNPYGFYNVTTLPAGGGDNTTWNEIRADTKYANINYSYNQTTPFTNWLSSFLFNYNQSSIFSYNHTQASNTSILGTYGKWFYNMTTSGSATSNDGITLKYQNITNVPSCTSGQFLTNTSGLACATPSGSGGTVYVPTGQPILVRQLNQLSTNNNTLWSDTDLKFDIYGGNNYTMVCDIMFRSDIATTGMSINLSSNFSSSNVNIAYNTWSSATAPVGFSATAFNTAFIGTGSGATIIRPNLLIADFTATSTGAVIVKMRSEISGSNAIIDRGSKCELYNRTAYQLTPVSNVTGKYPATAYQYRDLVTTNVTAWNQTSLNFSLDNAKTYNLVCDILFTGAAATTGQAINLTSTATTSNVNIMYNTWSSATANVGFSATAFEQALIGTGSGGTIIQPNLIIADFTTTSTGTLSLTFRSEVGASASTMKRGSTCRLYDMT